MAITSTPTPTPTPEADAALAAMKAELAQAKAEAAQAKAEAAQAKDQLAEATAPRRPTPSVYHKVADGGTDPKTGRPTGVAWSEGDDRPMLNGRLNIRIDKAGTVCLTVPQARGILAMQPEIDKYLDIHGEAMEAHRVAAKAAAKAAAA